VRNILKLEKKVNTMMDELEKRGEKCDLFYLFTTHDVKIINELFGGDKSRINSIE
jgi:hypothetical protein